MTATAGDQDGTVTKVDFMQFQPDVFISTDATAPYSGNWVNVPAGSYSLVAVATDSSGLTTISPAVHVTISATPPQPVVDAGHFQQRCSLHTNLLRYGVHGSQPRSIPRGRGQS